MASAPLAGRVIAVTRPLAQGGELARLISAAGGEPLLAPLLAIGPATETGDLLRAAAAIATYDAVVFVSANAVDYGLPALRSAGELPQHLLAFAVGPSTVRCLQAQGVGRIRMPQDRFDSEGLLELPELQSDAVGGRRILVLRGNGGRELLADTLRLRGAVVDCVACYRREAPEGAVAPLLAAWKGESLDAITVSSSEALRWLVAELGDAGREFLAQTPLFVPHSRIAAVAHDLGLRHTVLTAPADVGIVAGLCAYNWPTS